MTAVAKVIKGTFQNLNQLKPKPSNVDPKRKRK